MCVFNNGFVPSLSNCVLIVSQSIYYAEVFSSRTDLRGVYFQYSNEDFRHFQFVRKLPQ